MLPEQQQRIMGYFIEEAKDHLNTIEQGLLNLQATIEDPEMANEVFRAAHSVKGGAAMLGIESVQQTAHRMEDYFKILKESPIRADRALESMFLQVFDALHELLEQLQGPFGLTDDKAQEIMTGVEPVFGQLHKHLNKLVVASGGVQAAVAQQPTVEMPVRQAASRTATSGVGEDSALQLVFKSDVSACLREMLSLFKQDDTGQSRHALQEVCRRLEQFGEQFELPAWLDLIKTARLVLGHGGNDYRTLAPVLIKNIKSAQDLVLAGRDSEINVSQAMQSLMPEDLISTESAEIGDLDNLFEDTDEPVLENNDQFDDLFTSDPLAVEESAAREVGLTLDLGAGTDLAIVDFQGLIEDEGLDNILESGTSDSATISSSDVSLDDLLSTGADPMGPEVGVAELNSLADLFEGDLGDLDDSWQEEEVAFEPLRDTSEMLDVDISSDFADLLEESSSKSDVKSSFESGDELADLFGEVLPETTDTSDENLNLTDGLDDFSSLDIGLEALKETPENTVAFESIDLGADFTLDIDNEGEALSRQESLDTSLTSGFELGDLETNLGNDDAVVSEISDILDPSFGTDLNELDFETALTTNPTLEGAETDADFNFDVLDLESETPLSETSSVDDSDRLDMDFGSGLDGLDFEASLTDEGVDEEPGAFADRDFDFNSLDLSGNEISGNETGAASDPASVDDPDGLDMDFSSGLDGLDIEASLADESTSEGAEASENQGFDFDALDLLEDEIVAASGSGLVDDADELDMGFAAKPNEAAKIADELFLSTEVDDHAILEADLPDGGDAATLGDRLELTSPDPEGLMEMTTTGDNTFDSFFEANLDQAQTSASIEHIADEIDDFFDTGLAASSPGNEISNFWEETPEITASARNSSELDLSGSDLDQNPWDDHTFGLTPEAEPTQNNTNQPDDVAYASGADLDVFDDELLADFGNGRLSDLNDELSSIADDHRVTNVTLATETELSFIEDSEAVLESSVNLSDMFESMEEDALSDLSPPSDEDLDIELIGDDTSLAAGLTDGVLAGTSDELDLGSESVDLDLLDLSETALFDQGPAREQDVQLEASLTEAEVEADELSLDFLNEDGGFDLTGGLDAIASNTEPTPSTPIADDTADLSNFNISGLSEDDLDFGDTLDAVESGFSDEFESLLSDDDISETSSTEIDFDMDTTGMASVDENLLDDLDFSEASDAEPDFRFDAAATAEELAPETDATAEFDSDLANEFDNFGALLDETPESTDTLEPDDFNNLDILINETPETTSTLGEALDDFDNLEALIDDAPEPETTSALGEALDDFDNLEALIDDAPEPESNLGGALDDFDSLEALIDDAPEPESNLGGALDDFDSLEALIGEGVSEPARLQSLENSQEADEFSDLEALLAEDELSGKPPIPMGRDAEPEENEFEDLERLLEEADQTLGGPPGASTTRRTMPATNRLSGRRGSGVLSEQTMRVSVKHLDNLSNLVGELVVNRNTLEQDQERLRQFLDNLLFQVQQLNDVGQRMRDLYERSLLESSLISSRQNYQLATAMDNTASAMSSHATGETFDALEMDRFTGFHTLSQEMIELIVRVRESSSDIAYTVESSDQVTRQFRQVTTQLQEGLNKARMVPFAQTADRLPRAVRDISLKCGKEARLVVEGRDTLIDKMILEQLYDPMTHLVNNAITHGVETPDIREGAGKSREGAITVRAFYQGNQTVIYVADDGGGIDPELVKQKAVQKGLISSAEAKSMSVLDVYELLFHPGFSTRDQADDFAGRGVGMDVVRTSLADIRGSVTIDSELGKGTSFTIRLPLTLSISKALSCISNQARIAFPMDGVEDMFDVPRERIQQNEQGQQCILWRDTLLPFQQLSDLLKFNRTLGRGRVYGGHQDDDVISIVVLRSASTYIALEVDQVIGEQEIVIKQLEGPVPKPVGIAGATVLGDGRVMPIADVLELIDLAMGRVRRDPAAALWNQSDASTPEEPAAVKSEPTVLIVDDSITVRELLSMSFNKVGYRVEQARDGQEAWEKLRAGLPCDLVFCDIEMPRMDGLELLSRMQKDNVLKRIPIAMLTSRGADRHRQMAVDLGASGYFTKPYLEEALLDAAQKMLSGAKLV